MKPQRVYSAGTFDLPHAGHIDLLRICGQIGSVTVALNTDAFVARYKGNPPVLSYEERRVVLSAIRWVDAVVPQDSEDLRPQLEQIRPDFIVVGSDWARKDYYAQTGLTQDWLDDRGITLCYAPRRRVLSSTDVKLRVV